MPENLPQSHQAAQKRPLVATSGKRLRPVQDFCRPRKDFDENSRQTQKSWGKVQSFSFLSEQAAHLLDFFIFKLAWSGAFVLIIPDQNSILEHYFKPQLFSTLGFKNWL